MSEEKKYVTNFTFPNGETFYVKDENTYTKTEIDNKIDGSGSGDTNVQSDWNQTDSTADDYIKNKPDIYTKAEINQKITGAMTYKGTKAAVSGLPNSGNQQGDVWHINEDGSEWAWNGSSWEELGKDGAAVTEQTVAGWGFTKNTGTYSKPMGGIPDSDIASAATWNAKGTYSKPSGGIPASDLAAGVIPTVPQMATQPDMSDWTSGKTVDAAVLKTDFQNALAQLGEVQDDIAKKANASDIPTAVSQLTNDSGYQTAAQVQTAIANAAELPTGGSTGDFLRKTASGVAWQTVPSAEGSSF